MFNKKIAKEIRLLITSCEDFQILCRLNDGDQPTIQVAGNDSTGNKLVVVTSIDPGWIKHANCSGQFVPQFVDTIRELFGKSSKSLHADRRTILSRTFLQGTLLPLLDRD